MVDVSFGYDHALSLVHSADVHKRQHLGILVNYTRGQVATDDSTERAYRPVHCDTFRFVNAYPGVR